ncbi:ferritin family protein [Orenia marismortui]|uniref:Rubrerythrin n=1 Tax=Orenia marismortui TaxID=46469 RepID=A0A4V3GYK4_9FIRM|nr:ferritin-like domain-containing protein [Orenia marismortui]TDX53251.1 rubrerythrin [Orenia marismortui]
MKFNNLTQKDILEITRELMKMRKENVREVNGEDLSFLLQEMYLSIENELRDSAYYRALADIAPNEFAAEMINEFAKDEREHAYQLQKAYERLTGDKFLSQYEYEFELDAQDYQEYLEKRVIDETADYKKYKSYYLMTNNPYLRDIFFNAMHDEMQHAVRELYLIHMYMENMGMM